MSLGNISLDTITITNKNTSESLVLSDVCLMRGLSFSSSRSINTLSLDYGLYTFDIKEFKPEDILLKIKYYDSVESLKHFIRGQGTYKLDFVFAHKNISVDVVFSGDTIDTYTIVDSWEIRLMTTSMFYIDKTYNYVYSETQGLTYQYPYTYPFRYSSSVSPQNFGILNIINNGDIEAGVNITIYGAVENPSIGVDNYSTNTINSYRSTVTVPTGSVLHYKTLIPDYTITIDNADVTSSRQFNSYGFIRIPTGEHSLYLENVATMDMLIREYYYNV